MYRALYNLYLVCYYGYLAITSFPFLVFYAYLVYDANLIIIITIAFSVAYGVCTVYLVFL